MLPCGYSHKAFCARPGSAVICNFWHPGTLALKAERQSVRMSKITNDDSTLSGTGCCISVPYGNSRRQMVKIQVYRLPSTSPHSTVGVVIVINNTVKILLMSPTSNSLLIDRRRLLFADRVSLCVFHFARAVYSCQWPSCKPFIQGHFWCHHWISWSW